MFTNIGEKVGVAVLSAVIIGALALLWQTFSDGTLIKLLGGVPESELQSLAGHPHPVSALSSVPQHAVVAFDTPDSCPNGWSPFAEAQSRFMIGATFGLDNNLATTVSLTQYKYRGHDGEETVTLTEPQIPKHNHGLLSVLDNKPLPPPIDAKRHVPIAGPYTGEYMREFDMGDSQPHNNMPPYIALYFCKKD